MEKYPLWFEDKQVGEVTVQRRGLYYYFECICRQPTDIGSRVQVQCGEKITDLGICVPENGSYLLRKQIPIKHIGEGKLHFCIHSHTKSAEKGTALFADKPFAEMASLDNAKLMMKDGMHYIYWD